jgi:hypothetical protein
MMMIMRKIFVITSGLVLLDVVLQFYFAAVGAFTRPQTNHSFALHATNATVILLLPLLNTLVAALAKAGGRTIALAALPSLLVVVQILLFVIAALFIPEGAAKDADGVPLNSTTGALVVLGFHALNGLAILGVSGTVLARARALAAAAVPAQAVAA